MPVYTTSCSSSRISPSWDSPFDFFLFSTRRITLFYDPFDSSPVQVFLLLYFSFGVGVYDGKI